MPRDGHRVIAVDVAVHVGKLDVGFVNGALSAMGVREEGICGSGDIGAVEGVPE